MNKFSNVLQSKLLRMYPEIEFEGEDNCYGENTFSASTDKLRILYMFNDETKIYELRAEPKLCFNKWSQAVYQNEIGKSNVDSVLKDLEFINNNIKTFCEMSNNFCIYYADEDLNLQDWYKEVTKDFTFIECENCGEIIFIDELNEDLCMECEEECKEN